MAAQTAPDKGKLVQCVVAPRRTLRVDDQHRTQNVKHHGPGSVVYLDEVEAKRLRALGYVTDPQGGYEPVAADGPNVESLEDGAADQPKATRVKPKGKAAADESQAGGQGGDDSDAGVGEGSGDATGATSA